MIRDSKIEECAGYRITGFILEKPNPHARTHSTAIADEVADVEGAGVVDKRRVVTILAG